MGKFVFWGVLVLIVALVAPVVPIAIDFLILEWRLEHGNKGMD